MSYKKNRLKPRGQEVREATRLRVEAFRERQREKAEAEEEASASQERLFADMRRDGLLFFGETAPTRNCINIAEEIQMARIWAPLLGVRDIEPGENQRAYILTVLKAWCSAECPLLHLETRTLSKRKVDVPDVEKYEFPQDSDTPYAPIFESETETGEVTNG